VLIVGCGCRGRELAAALVAEGHAVRGTTRRPEAADAIEAAGAEAVVADPDRLATLLPALEGVSAACWLMGSVAVPALHGERLETLLETLVDTPVRGLVYEGAGSVAGELLGKGAALASAAAERWRMPIEIVDRNPADRGAWLAGMTRAVGRVLGG